MDEINDSKYTNVQVFRILGFTFIKKLKRLVLGVIINFYYFDKINFKLSSVGRIWRSYRCVFDTTVRNDFGPSGLLIKNFESSNII